MRRLGLSLVILADLLVSTPSLAAKKDYKGLFGSYRREKFTENEARSTDFGFDVMLSTLFPVSSVAESTEDRTTGASPMPSSNFFNVEGNLFFTLDYNWQIYASVGYFNFDTRRENTIFTQANRPLFQQFEMTAMPVVAGVKYRFSEEDIVPYVGLGVGMAFVTRKAGYDYSALSDEEKTNCVAGQIVGGVEFYFHSRAGIRLEVGAYNFRLGARTFDPTAPSGNANNNPIIVYSANPWLVRYASGIFILL